MTTLPLMYDADLSEYDFEEVEPRRRTGAVHAAACSWQQPEPLDNIDAVRVGEVLTSRGVDLLCDVDSGEYV